jgi:hypothetical protein
MHRKKNGTFSICMYEMSERSMVSLPPEKVLSETAFSARDEEDKEIVATVMRLQADKGFILGEIGALLYVLKVDTKLWPPETRPFKDDPDFLQKELAKADAYGKEKNWLIGKFYTKDIDDRSPEGNLLFFARTIAWAQNFLSGVTNRTLQGYVTQNPTGQYPTYMQSFLPEKARKDFLQIYNPPPIEPSEEKSGGSGGVGFLIGAVVIALLAVGILMYFLLR